MGMDERVKKLWTGALRSGEYQQGHGALRTIEADGKPKDCCLGVLCDLFAKENPNGGEWDGESGTIEFRTYADDDFGDDEVKDDTLPLKVQEWAGLDTDDPVLFNAQSHNDHASAWNDGAKGLSGEWVREPATFTEIADMVERSL